jgi:hypothetical protein
MDCEEMAAQVARACRELTCERAWRGWLGLAAPRVEAAAVPVTSTELSSATAVQARARRLDVSRFFGRGTRCVSAYTHGCLRKRLQSWTDKDAQ